MKSFAKNYALCKTALTLLPILALLPAGLTPAMAGPPETVLHTFNSYGDGYQPGGGLVQGSDGAFYGTTSNGGTDYRGTVFKINTSGTLTTIYSFTYLNGTNPSGDLIQGKDGLLYGTTQYGGDFGDGTIYQVSTDGTSFKTLHSFNAADGETPAAGPIQGKDDLLYGTTQYGGTNGDGTVYQISTDGTTFNSIHSFSGTDGEFPSASVVQATDGNLYGTTAGNNTPNNFGTIFQISTDGSTFNTIHSFQYHPDGANPVCALIQGKDSLLYGTASYGGGIPPYGGTIDGVGTAFQISTDGTTFNILHSFINSDPAFPFAGVIQAIDGKLYGATYSGGANNTGAVFQLSTDGTTFKTLYNFPNNGINPSGKSRLIQGSDNKFYGTAVFSTTDYLGMVFSLSTDGTTFTTLFDFANRFFDGQNPGFGSLTQGPDGALYGTTQVGSVYGSGSLYRFDPDTQLITILQGFYGSNGAVPLAGVSFGTNGTIYGTTHEGGANNYGTIYSYNPATQAFSSLYSFTDGSDGSYLFSGVTVFKSALYGAASSGGQFGYGTVFKLTLPTKKMPTPQLTTLHAFTGGNDGAYPQAGLIEGSSGNFFGTTYEGGTNNDGTVFKITPAGALTTLHSFTGSDGINPFCNLLQTSDGNLYGTTLIGGAYGYGTVFKVSPSGKPFKVLYSFNGSDGAYPTSGLILGSDGFLYGTTAGGGTSYLGTVYQISTDGKTFNSLYSFLGGLTDGNNPIGGVIEGTDGNLYGTTQYNGVSAFPGIFTSGTIFQLQTGLQMTPTITSFSPADVQVGKTVAVKGLNLGGATSVTVNGVVQTIIKDTTTQLTFKVVAGTTTGLIVVTTPYGSATTSTELIIY